MFHDVWTTLPNSFARSMQDNAISAAKKTDEAFAKSTTLGKRTSQLTGLIGYGLGGGFGVATAVFPFLGDYGIDSLRGTNCISKDNPILKTLGAAAACAATAGAYCALSWVGGHVGIHLPTLISPLLAGAAGAIVANAERFGRYIAISADTWGERWASGFARVGAALGNAGNTGAAALRQTET